LHCTSDEQLAGHAPPQCAGVHAGAGPAWPEPGRSPLARIPQVLAAACAPGAAPAVQLAALQALRSALQAAGGAAGAGAAGSGGGAPAGWALACLASAAPHAAATARRLLAGGGGGAGSVEAMPESEVQVGPTRWQAQRTFDMA